MGRRLILDTGVLVATERTRTALAGYLTADDDVALSSITVAELWTGVELASEARRQARLEFVEGVLATFVVLPHTESVAKVHGRLLAHVHRTGRPRGAHDLAIAAVAVATSRILVTTDRRAAFADLPDLRWQVLPAT